MYGHPSGVHVSPLIDFPWVVFEQASPVDSGEEATSVGEKLEVLGYMQ